jgi:hypothetical protein
MKPINEFTEQDGILINNDQESQEIREMLHGMGFRWHNGEDYVSYETLSVFPFCIYPRKGVYVLETKLKENDTIHPASDYIIKPGDEVEGLWDDMWMNNENYIGKTLNGIYITEDKSGYIYKREAIRKAPNPKSKAIAEIKKIAEENGITVEIK